ncbi:hypothetical protein KKJFFJLC_00012 [Vibrio phage vB_VpaS_PGB]|nr:hypothetical protein HHKILHMN_00024 [Vibrio phage vB_VpaS_PGA]WVH05555.1 hypothetical protein KKJFFJLC_00012 [Vibrio phage vB_VpaS_PGB]
MKRYREDGNGYVKFENIPLSKAGVFPYLGSQLPASLGLVPDQIYMVFRPESELNNPETIESFKGVPWYNKHVMTGDQFGVSPEEVGVYGSTGDNIEYRDGSLYGNLHLFAKTLKESIKAGLKELSCGFACVYELVSGVAPNGDKYDVIQKEIRGNHLASVPEGRMGSEVSVAMDSLTFAIDELNLVTKPDGGNGMNEELKALLAKLKEAEPAEVELKKLYDEIGAALGISSPESKLEEGEDEDMNKPEMKPEEGMDMDKPESGMDAAVLNAALSSIGKSIENLSAKVEKLEGSAMDESAVMAAFTERQELISQVTPIIGNFEHAGMNRQQVAKYATEKLGIACDSGAEVTALRAFLHGRKQPTFTMDKGDGQDSAVKDSKVLDEMGL